MKMRNCCNLIRAFWHKNSFLIICAFIAFSLTVYHRLDNVNFWSLPKYIPCDSSPYSNNPTRFSGNMNHDARIPNLVHFIRFGHDAKCFTTEQVSSLVSVVENHGPLRIYIHSDDVDSVKSNVRRLFSSQIQDLIEVRFYPQPKHVFGLNFSEVHRHRHAIDFTKLKLLRRFGGIYLENSVRVFRDLRKFLNFEMTIVVRPRPDHEIQVALTDDVLVAHKDARFLNLWLKTYHEYNSDNLKHLHGAAMESLLKHSRHYVHTHQQDLPPIMDSLGEEFKSVMYSKRYFFATTKDSTQCV